MKKQLVLLFSIFFLSSPSVFADVLYCSSDGATGFDLEQNYKITTFENRRFQVKINFQNQKMVSEKIWLTKNILCMFDDVPGTLICTSVWGTTLAIHKETLKFHYSTITLAPGESKDGIAVYHGQCEKF